MQAAITQARQALTTAAAPASPTITGPTRLATGTTSDTAVKTVDILDPGVTPNPDVKVTVAIGPATMMVGPEQSVVCTIAPGGMNIDTLVTTTLARTVTTTTTTLTTEHWQLEGTTGTSTTYTQYLAEGATSAFFDTQLALLNPGTVATTATLTFTPANAPLVVSTVAVPAHTRVTVNPKTIAGLAVAEFSTKVESAQRLIVDRTMTWDATGYGAHAETSVAAPAPTWYLAEGATHTGFDLFYLIQNPHPTDAAEVRVRYLRPSGAPLEKIHVVPAHSRATIWVDFEQIPAASGRTPLADTDVSAVIESLDGVADHRRARHVPRVARAGLRRRAREHGRHRPRPAVVPRRGRDRPLLRPVRARREPRPRGRGGRSDLPPAGRPTVVKRYPVAANSRFTIWVDYEDARLADTAVSTTIRATNGVPVIVERAMWWPGAPAAWSEGHNSAGATATGTRWALAEGEVGGARGTETYLLIANTSAVRRHRDGDALLRGRDVRRRAPTICSPRSRTNVAVAADFGAAVTDRRFGAMVEATGDAPVQIVVERAMYSNAGGVRWAAGTNAQATRLP